MEPKSGSPALGERRQITVAFCDLANSTALSTELDPEDLRDVIRSFQEVARTAIEGYGGTVAQHLGDGILAYFGYPRAHEDDATRACHASLALIDGLRNSRLPALLNSGSRLSVRVGLHTGPVVVDAVGATRAEEFLAIGETPNRAARIQALAPPNAVMCSAATFRLIERAFRCELFGEFELKGLGKSQAVYRVFEAARMRASQSRTPMVGRGAEQSTLAALWATSCQGSGHTLFVRGAAGAGKTRLIESWAQETLGTGTPVVTAYCSSYHRDSAMHPIRMLVRALLDWNEHDDEVERSAKLRRFAGQAWPGNPEALALLAGFVGSSNLIEDRVNAGLSPQIRRKRTEGLLLELLLQLARKQPLALAIEDVQWIDPSSSEFLSVLQERLEEVPLLVVLTARAEQSLSVKAQVEIALSRLSRKAMISIISSITQEAALPESVIEQICEKAEGNPLFVEELTRMVLHARGTESRGDGPVRGNAARWDLAIPSTLQDSLMSRVDSLDPDHKAVVQLCATLGREFSYELIDAVLRSFDGELRTPVERITDGDLIVQRGVAPSSTFSFKSALVQDVAYGALVRKTRAHYHSHIADVLTRSFPGTPPETIARHCEGAARFDEAAGHWHASGGAALQAFALPEALGHLQRAIENVERLPSGPRRSEAELRIRITLGVPLMLTQGFASEAVGTNYQRILTLCDEVDDAAHESQFHALWGLWTFHIVSGRFGEAKSMADRLGALGQRTGDSNVQLAAHCAIGTASMMMARFDEARTQFLLGLQVYEPSRHASLALVLGQDAGVMCASFLTWVHYHLGDQHAAENTGARAVSMCEQLGQPSSSAFAGTVLATWDCLRGRFESALQRSDQVIQLAEQQGMPHWNAQASITRGWALGAVGQFEEGARTARAGIDALLAIGSRSSMSFYWGGLAEIELAAGQLGNAREALRKGFAYVELSDERINEGGLHLIDGQLAVAEGDSARARRALEGALRFADGTGASTITPKAKRLLATLT